MSTFSTRHIGTSASQQEMLSSIGVDSLAQLSDKTIPSAIRVDAEAFTLPPAVTESEALHELQLMAQSNVEARSLIGMGYYGTNMPSVLRRCILENPSWYTAYTPYQPEISQGRLEALVNFQTMITDLTATDIAGASMLDEGTAAVEGMLLARRVTKGKRNTFVVDADLLPQTQALLAARAKPLGIELVTLPLADFDATSEPLPEDTFGVIVQYPGASGLVWDPSALFAAVHEAKGIAIAAADLLALTVLKAPGELGADVVVGTTQRFGIPMGFGGPHAGYMGVRAAYERQLPGRLVGVSKDADGNPAYRLALQTREQHIRRERATSNICTAQVLLAVLAAMYAVYHGPAGLRKIGSGVHDRTLQLAKALRAAGFDLAHDSVFDTLQLEQVDADALIEKATAAGLRLWKVDQTSIRLSVDETFDAQLITQLGTTFGLTEGWATTGAEAEPTSLARTSEYLTHPVFNSYHSETAMIRYLKRLADYDYALDKGMIPLGSCTMKLNAATEMMAITWGQFANIHPFVPRADVSGYLKMISDLEAWLANITGYDAVSLQPNAGSQGELSGLLAIRRYHESRGDAQRTICLIPESAHGTNAASATLAGLKVKVVACDSEGNVDLADLREKITAAGDSLAALMITYPSTHGVYEAQVKDICRAVHTAGGQVYIDGANLNALVGFARFGDFGGDVSHLNLHKTFAIPHGGGGPGVGPVAAKAHLAEFLPGHMFAQDDESVARSANIVAAAPYGSASVLPISWAYIKMMGIDGLQDATASAVLAANYVSHQLAGVVPTLYTEDGWVAHECILDFRPLTEQTGITIDDVAKRLVDYGFHAPTMSFPVAGTLMVEPTESEDLAELDRFVAAVAEIVAEAKQVQAGSWPADDNPLVNSPHTAQTLVADDWDHPYSRATAVYPFLANPRLDAEAKQTAVRSKYWPPVRRLDNAWGDRHLVCTCPDPSAFETDD